jgi:hypothetical protein
LAPGTDITPIVPALEKIWADSLGQSMASFNFRTVTSKFNELVYQYPIRIPERYSLVIRCDTIARGWVHVGSSLPLSGAQMPHRVMGSTYPLHDTRFQPVQELVSQLCCLLSTSKGVSGCPAGRC